MKAKELMIADWVYNTYLKKTIRWTYGDMFTPDFIPITGRDVEPIPLTEDILKANGFEYKDNVEEWWHYDEFPLSDFQLNDSYDEERDEWCVSIRINNCDYNIHYVHELQHALRICGLTELADNFKITNVTQSK